MKLNNNDDSHNSGLNLLIYNMLLDIESHPTWVCGLKLPLSGNTHPACGVTPYVGVWIETIRMNTWSVRRWSHPTWVCGLKPALEILRCTDWKSHTLRGCVDWNKSAKPDTRSSFSHTLRGCVDWNRNKFLCLSKRSSHTLRGCVDWNYFWASSFWF